MAVSEQMPGFALLGRELDRCGWRRTTAGPLEGEIFFQTARGGVRAPAQPLETEHGERLLVVDFGEFELGNREELFGRFLDFSMETRMALGAARLLAGAGQALIMSGGRIDLYRLPAETLDYSAVTAREFEDELLPALAGRVRGRAEGPPPAEASSESTTALRGWLAHWSRTLSAHLEADRTECERLVWKIVLMLQASRKTGRSEMVGGWGLGCEQLGAAWSVSYDSLATHADLNRTIDEFDETFSTRIFGPSAERDKAWLAELEETSLIEQLRAELLMQAQVKFEAENVAWLYTEMDREQEGWRREVKGLKPIRKRIETDGWSVLRPLVCDVGRYGLVHALRELNRLAAYWSEQDSYHRGHDEARLEALYTQPDLFHAAARGVSPMNQLDDGANFLLSESIRLRGVAPSEEFGVGLAFLLKTLDLVQTYDWPFFGVDSLDRVFEPSEE